MEHRVEGARADAQIFDFLAGGQIVQPHRIIRQLPKKLAAVWTEVDGTKFFLHQSHRFHFIELPESETVSKKMNEELAVGTKHHKGFPSGSAEAVKLGIVGHAS